MITSLSLDSGNLEVNGSNELAIKASGVGATELSADCVDGSKVADDAIDSEHIAAGAVDAAHLAGSIPVSKLSDYLAAGSVSASNMFGTGVVPSAALEDDAVSSAKLASNLSFEGQSTQASANADASSFRKAYYQATSDATQTDVTLFQAAESSAYMVEIKASCRDNTSGDKAAYKASFCCSRGSGSTGAMDSASNVEVVHEDDSSWAFACVVASDGTVKAQVTGDASNACKWSISCDATRVSN